MFTQQIIGLIIIAYFLIRLYLQKKQKQINANEFYFWLIFWIIAGAAVLLLKQIDLLVRNLGFTASGIDVLLYLAVVTLFYFVFRLRIRMARIEHNITRVVREMAIKNKNYE
ncbi:MAG: DUF2304 family protein [Patescibacteria group bacterium]|jgi:hypothetical protein